MTTRPEPFRPGERVELISTTDPYTRLKPGDRGTVLSEDGLGTVHVRWDSGSSLGMVLDGPDDIRRVEARVSTPRFPDIRVELDLNGEEGNAFHIVGLVAKALHAVGAPWEEYRREALSADSYDELLAVTRAWVQFTEL